MVPSDIAKLAQNLVDRRSPREEWGQESQDIRVAILDGDNFFRSSRDETGRYLFRPKRVGAYAMNQNYDISVAARRMCGWLRTRIGIRLLNNSA